MSRTTPYYRESPKEFRDRPIRYILTPSGVLGADPAAWSYIDGNSAEVTFGGTETDGNYVITVDPVRAGIASFAITTVRAGGTPATNTLLAASATSQIGTLLTTAAGGADPDTVLSTYIASATSALGVVTLLVQPDAPPFRITTSAPAPGTLVVAPDDQFPIVFGAVGYGPVAGPKTSLEITVIPVDASRVPLDPGTATVQLTVHRAIDRSSLNITGGTPVGVANSATVVVPISQPLHIDSASGYYTFSVETLGGAAITGLEGLEVWVREINR